MKGDSPEEGDEEHPDRPLAAQLESQVGRPIETRDGWADQTDVAHHPGDLEHNDRQRDQMDIEHTSASLPSRFSLRGRPGMSQFQWRCPRP